MDGAVKFNLDTREFDAALREYVRLNKRDFAVIVNSKALQIAFKSLEFTKPANRAQIMRELKQIPNIYRLVNYNRRRHGLAPARRGDEMNKAVQQFLNFRTRSIGYLRAGWIPAIQKLDKLVPRKELRQRRRAKVNHFGKNLGYAEVNRNEFHPVTTIVNQTFKSQAALQKGEDGIRRAIAFVVQDMKQYIERKLQESADKVNA